MLPQAPARIEPRCPCRGMLTAGVLLILMAFVWGVGRAAPAPPSKDEPKKPQTKKDKPAKDEPSKAELKKEQSAKDETKKSDADKEIDDLVKEMTRTLPAGDKATRQLIREQVQNMPAENRKNMLRMMRNRQRPGFPIQGPGAGVMPPGFAWFNQNGRLGARVEPVSAALAEQLDLPKGQGLVVREVVAESAAAKSGIKTHDVLLEFNGKAVPNHVEEFARQVADIKPDKAVDIVVMRKGKKETLKGVKLPEAKAGVAGFPPIGFPGAGQPPAGFPQLPAGLQPPAGFPQAPGIGGAASVVTTMVRTQERFTLRHQEGSLVITLTGRSVEGKPKIKEISVQDGVRSERYESADKVPEQYRDKVKNLIEMSEKGSVRIEVK